MEKTKKALTSGLLAFGVAAMIVAAPAASASAASRNFGALNCGSSLILSSAQRAGSNGGDWTKHTHYQGGGYRTHTGWNVYTYYNSGWTSVSSVIISTGTVAITSASRSCDW